MVTQWRCRNQKMMLHYNGTHAVVNFYLDYNEQVAQTYDYQRQEESDEEGEEYESCVIEVLGLWPHNTTNWHFVQATEDHSW